MRCNTRGRAKGPEEMTAAVANGGRELLEGEVRMQAALDELLNARQLASSEGRWSV